MNSYDFQSDREYSYPSNLSLTPPPEQSQRPLINPPDQPGPPRLSSPHHFRGIFETNSRLESSPARLPDPGISSIDYYRETMNDVNRALQSANRAIQTAQEAFQSRRTPFSANSRQHDIVDLTGTSPPMASTTVAEDGVLDHYLSRMTHPHDLAARQPGIQNLLNEPLYGSGTRYEADPMTRYTGPDSLAASRRRYDIQQFNNFGPFSMETRTNRPGPGQVSRTDEEAAIRRQRVARAQWEVNQRQTAERQRLETQRQRLLNSGPITASRARPSISPARGQQSVMRPSAAPPAVAPTPAPAPAPAPASPASSRSSVEAVDLTQVDDDPSLVAALSKQRQDAIALQNTSPGGVPTNSGIGSSGGRTPLTAYKCPICMEPPQNATTTSCGHLFCHKCIIDTLKWSEQQRRDDAPPSRKVKGVCPVCRKELARKEEPGQGRTLIALELKMLSRKELKRKREEEEQRRKKRQESKGKGKLLSDGEGDEGSSMVEVKHESVAGGGVGSGQTSNSSSQRDPGGAYKRPKQEHEAELVESAACDSLFEFGLDEEFM